MVIGLGHLGDKDLVTPPGKPPGPAQVHTKVKANLKWVEENSRTKPCLSKEPV